MFFNTHSEKDYRNTSDDNKTTIYKNNFRSKSARNEVEKSIKNDKMKTRVVMEYFYNQKKFCLCNFTFFYPLLLLLFISSTFSIPCFWDETLNSTQIIQNNCGYTCPDPWSKINPYTCGNAPHYCCCSPTNCDLNRARKNAFIGVNWSDKYCRQKLDRNEMFKILKRNNIYHLKIFSFDGLYNIKKVYVNDNDDTISTTTQTDNYNENNGRKDEINVYNDDIYIDPEGVNVYLALPNRLITRIVTDEKYAYNLVKKNILPYIDIVRVLVVGNEPFLCIKSSEWLSKRECGSLNIPSKLLPAMLIMKNILIYFNYGHIPVTTSFNGGILEMSQNPWTPCISDYRDTLKPLLLPIWNFLQSQRPKAPFIINIYSWFASIGGHIDTSFAIGHPVKEKKRIVKKVKSLKTRERKRDDRNNIDSKINFYLNMKEGETNESEKSIIKENIQNSPTIMSANMDENRKKQKRRDDTSLSLFLPSHLTERRLVSVKRDSSHVKLMRIRTKNNLRIEVVGDETDERLGAKNSSNDTDNQDMNYNEEIDTITRNGKKREEEKENQEEFELVDKLSLDGKFAYFFNFDMQRDMHIIAMCKNNIADLELWVGETGWPTHDHKKASLKNSRIYFNNVIKKARGESKNDRTRIANIPYTVFLFEAFDEQCKFQIEHGNRFENSYGLFYENGQPKWMNPHGYLDIPLHSN